MTLSRLKHEAAKMKAAKKVLTKQLRNAKRVNQRLKAKARKLSDADLLAIVAMRQSPKSAVSALRATTSIGDGHGGGTGCSSSSSSSARADSRAPGDDNVEAPADLEASDGAALGPGVDHQRLAERMAL